MFDLWARDTAITVLIAAAAVFFGVLLIFSGIAWGIWAIAILVKKKKQ